MIRSTGQLFKRLGYGSSEKVEFSSLGTSFMTLTIHRNHTNLDIKGGFIKLYGVCNVRCPVLGMLKTYLKLFQTMSLNIARLLVIKNMEVRIKSEEIPDK